MHKRNIPQKSISFYTGRINFYLETIKKSYERINSLEKENAELRDMVRKFEKEQAA